MQYRRLGHSSLLTSAVGIGGLHFGIFVDQVNTTRIIHRALDLGVNFIDTAPLYGHGHSEAFIGNAIQGHREEVFVTTKVGLEPNFAPDGSFYNSVVPLTKERIRSNLEKSLRALGTDYIDFYQVHAFDPETPIEETMETLDALVREGKVRFLGCSNYNHTQLELASAVAASHGWAQFASFQVHYNLIERRAEQDIVPACRDLGVGIIINRALARGILTSKYKPNQPLPEASRAVTSLRVRRWLDEQTLLLVWALDTFARECGRSATELAIAWLLSRQSVSLVLIGVRNLEQLEICVRAVDWFLSDNDLIEVDKIIGGFGLMSQVTARPETFFER